MPISSGGGDDAMMKVDISGDTPITPAQEDIYGSTPTTPAPPKALEAHASYTPSGGNVSLTDSAIGTKPADYPKVPVTPHPHPFPELVAQTLGPIGTPCPFCVYPTPISLLTVPRGPLHLFP